MNAPSIKVFINPACGPCLTLKKWLKEQQISFIEKDLINDVSAAKEFRELGGKYTPTTIITTLKNETIEVIGADTIKIERILTENRML